MSSSSWHPQRDSTVLQRLAEVVQVPAEHQHVTSASSACPPTPLAPPPPLVRPCNQLPGSLVD